MLRVRVYCRGKLSWAYLYADGYYRCGRCDKKLNLVDP